MKKQIKSWVTFLFTAVCIFSSGAQLTQAQTATIAQFFQNGGGQDFVFTNSGVAPATFNTVSGGTPVVFQYQNLNPILPAELEGVQFATLVMTASTNQTTIVTVNSNDTSIDQPFNLGYEIKFLRNTPAASGFGTRTNLLTITITPATDSPFLTGTVGNSSASLSSSTPAQNVVFTSDFLNFDVTTQRNLALSFSSVVPNLQNDPNNFLRSFAAAGSGTIASNPLPALRGPTSAEANIDGRVLISRSRGRALGGVVIELLNTQTGEVRQTQSRSDGRFWFDNVAAGQFYILTAARNRFEFEPASIPLQVNGDMQDVNFSAVQTFGNRR